ncbi:MAG: SUMF1/EgtB/PvdO family nonheme iron enzyme [Acidobacteriota bacterium]
MLCAVLALVLSSCKKENPADAGIPDTRLAAPTGLQLLSMSETEVKLHWVDNNAHEERYLIEQSTDSLTYVQVGVRPADCDTATITGSFATTQTYYFRVKAANADTVTGASNTVSRTLFPAPSDMKIVSFASGAVSLTWKDNSDIETGFYIERAVDASAFTVVDSTGANVQSKTLSAPLDSAKTYAYRIVAHTASRRSAASNQFARSLGNWVYVAGGTFQMGRNDGYSDERPVHVVTVSGFYISKYEVTVKEFRRYTDAMKKGFPQAPSWGWSDEAPIVNVTWNDAVAYCKWLDSTTGSGARLPTEAEWEFAARGGNSSQHFRYSGSNTIGDVAWYYLNAGRITHRIGTKLPNELGLYDMSGNAWEWVSDWHGSYSWTPVMNPKGAGTGTNKVFRGGSEFDYGLAENECRVETRYVYTPGSKSDDGGFRVVRLR